MSEDTFAERVRRANESALSERKKAEDSFLDNVIQWIVEAKSKNQPEVTVFTTNWAMPDTPGEQHLSALYADVWRTLKRQNQKPFWKRSAGGTWSLMLRV